MTVLEDARAAVETGPVCDSCLGRLFADRSFGLANAERGRSLRVALALADDEPYEPPEDCWVCEGAAAGFDRWAKRAATAVRGYEFDTYQVGTRVPPLFEENDALLREEVAMAGGDADLGPDADLNLERDSSNPRDQRGEALKTEFNREVGKRVGEATGAEVDFERPDVQFLLDLATDEVEVQVNSAFVYGRYRKLERDIPQTEWPCRECNETGIKRGEECPGCDGTGYRYDESVEQLVAPPILEALDGEDATFHGAGREDVDARMLGTGRPFVVEVTEPRRRRVDVETLEADVNGFADGKAEVEDLRLATYEMVERVKGHDAGKTYRMDVAFEEPVEEAAFEAALDALDGATIEQRTPQRVDHRRADIDRTREVYAIEGTLVDDEGEVDQDEASYAEIELDGEGGLYVKELVSGDEGRTTPSLAGLLGVGAEVTALDVLAVEGEDEAFEQPAFFRE